MEGGEGQPINLTAAVAFFIGHAFAQWLTIRAGGVTPSVSVGRDPRLSGPMLEAALTAGLLSGGAVQVHSFGLATTPAMFSSIVAANDYQGAIMITASHMPFMNNGFKFFTADGGLEKADISDILQRAAVACATAGVKLGDSLSEQSHLLNSSLLSNSGGAQLRDINFLSVYAASLQELIKQRVAHKDTYHFPLAGLKIVVDAGNGSGGFFADQVLSPLGADTSGSQFLDPDGMFPNHIPNPENAEAMAAGSRAVLAAQADLGIVFDTDVDRSAIVDSSGREINSNRYIALQAAVVLRSHPGTTIVTDSVTSNGLTKFITDLGGKHFRYKRGYKNVIGKGVSLGKEGVDCQLMMETSGHGAVKENFYLDDGAYLAVMAVIEVVRRRQAGEGGISEMLDALPEALESKEVRIKITSKDFKSVGARVLEGFKGLIDSGKYPEWALEEVNHEGWRVSVDEGVAGRKGWLLLRQSLHDPLLVLNVESEVAGGVAAQCQRILAFIKSGPMIDLAALEKAASSCDLSR
ncbi:MAG: hypothetical protein WDW36_004965 [Sanguina aurantia]